MKLAVRAAFLCVLVVILLSETTYARPWFLSRQKRVSDQRLAELETIFALEKLKGIMVPVANGKVDLVKIGRKRRSISEDDILQRLLLHIARDADSTPSQSDQFRLLPWKEDPREEAQRNYQLI